MITNKEANTTTITQEKVSIIELIRNIESDYDKFKNDHLIIHLTSLDEIILSDITAFLSISSTHRNAKKSFVIVSNKVDLVKIPNEIIIVPTIQEAYDIIEMEDIERDLGF